MKRAGIVLALALLLLSGCATGPQTKETVSSGFQETVESYESAESLEDKQIKASNRVSETVKKQETSAKAEFISEKADPIESSSVDDEVRASTENERKTESSKASSSQPVESLDSKTNEHEDVTETREETDPVYEETPAQDDESEEESFQESSEETVTDPVSESESNSESETEPEVPPETAEVPDAQEAFDIGYWISYAKQCAVDHGLKLDATATDCWDNPITANASCIYLERDLNARMSRYASMADVTDVWIWYEDLGNERYLIYIGYA